jgi:YfiH family protein
MYAGGMAKKAAKPKSRAAKAPKPEPAAPNALILGTTEQPDGDWQPKQLAVRLDQLRRLVELRHRHRPRRIVWVDQAHGNKVLVADSAQGEDGTLGAGDALITDQPDVLMAIKTADCVPIFIESDRAVGLAHAGLAGVMKGILPKTVRKLKREYNVQPKNMAIRFGPHICRSCYRISDNNERLLADYPAAQEFISPRGSHRYFSMLDMLSAQAAELGVQKLSADNRCTYHSAGLFSARRSHGDQRMLSYIMLGSTTPPHA